MKDKKVVFMGTPQFSVPILKALIKHTNVIGVVTQPDKEVGRKRILTPSPVKVLALEYNIPVYEIQKLRKEYQVINDLNPDIIITCAYGQILPEELIYHPKFHTINVHGSLLPKLRGGAPIERAIMEGHKKTGITIMYTDKGMDSGDIITMEELTIEDNDNLDSLKEKMSLLGKDLLIKTLPSIFDGTASRVVQDHDNMTLAPLIKREDEHLDFSKTTKEVYNHIRGLSSEPGCYALLDDKEFKFFASEKGFGRGVPGEITHIYKDGIGVATSDGEIIVTKIQPPGKKVMFARDYLNGVDKKNLKGKVFK